MLGQNETTHQMARPNTAHWHEFALRKGGGHV